MRPPENFYTRASEHISRYKTGTATSFKVKHQASDHQGDDPSYKAMVTASTRDCLTRQVREAVLIRGSQVNVLNGKTKWHQPTLFRIRSEVERGYSV